MPWSRWTFPREDCRPGSPNCEVRIVTGALQRTVYRSRSLNLLASTRDEPVLVGENDEMGPGPGIEFLAQCTPTMSTRHHDCPSRTREDQSDGASHTCAPQPPNSARSAGFKASVRFHNRSSDEGFVGSFSGRESRDVQATGHFD